MQLMETINRRHVRTDVPVFRPGDVVRVHTKIREGDKERIQIFEGMVIRRRRGGIGATFTVRKSSYGVGVERVFPIHSPLVDRIEVVTKGRVRRAHLTYLRKLSGKSARVRQEERWEEVVKELGSGEPDAKASSSGRSTAASSLAA